MSNECTTHKVILCPENKIYVKQIQASITRQSSISDAVNKIITKARNGD